MLGGRTSPTDARGLASSSGNYDWHVRRAIDSGPDIEIERSVFWEANQPGFKFATAPVGTREFYRQVEAHRYALEPHIPEIADFKAWEGRDVLEVGCGIATDGARFAEAGARYCGLDFAGLALELAGRRFALLGLPGSFIEADATEIPFPDASFDLVYSHGVIHHISDTEHAIDEFHRVLRPGGTAVVMLYHRRSLNYFFTILTLRRLLAGTLLIPGLPRVAARITGEESSTLQGHRDLLRQYGVRYLIDSSLFLSRNTDGPKNALSKVYTRAEAERMFSAFSAARTEVRYLNLRIYPGGERLAMTWPARSFERRVGWHLYVRAVK